jgi:glycine/D-amino acid oxidase-like deaminating enzyme
VELVEVQFKGQRKELYINSRALYLHTGNYCVVQADRGEDMGLIISIVKVNPKDIDSDIKEVLRHATDSDDAENLAQLKHYLPNFWQELGGEDFQIVDRRVAFRCQSIDFLPLCGPLPVATDIPHRPAQGLYLNVAHGSRGITGTPLCAELIADMICGQPLPTDQEMIDALAPARFIVRKRKKQPEWMP